MRKKGYVLVIGIFLLLLSACTSAGTIAATATPIPPTVTLLSPTATPLPTATPVAVESAAEVVETPTAVPVRAFRVIVEESKALYRVEEEFFEGAVQNLSKKLGFNTAVAWTRTLEGELQLVTDGPTVTVEGGQFTVDLRTLKSDDRLRDERIREQFLQSNLFPMAEFVITGAEDFPTEYIEGEEVMFKLVGDFTMRETTNEVVFETTAILQDGTIKGTAFADIFMVDFGFDPPEILGFIKAQDPARVEIEFTAQETDPATASE